jgi:hypothetical protein
MNRWTEFRKRRKAKLEKLSDTAPVNISPPTFYKASDEGLYLSHRGLWAYIPTEYKYVWKLGDETISYETCCALADDESADDLTLTVTAINDNGESTVEATSLFNHT